MKVLVTGSRGFIGSRVCDELLIAGHDPVEFDRPFDIRNQSCLDAFGDVAAVINLAGQLGTEELLGAEYQAAEVNILGAVRVYDWAAALGIPVVQIGTGHKGQPNPYAITKGCAEDLALARARWLGQEIAVVRAYHVYGPGQKPPPPWGPSSVRKFFPTLACQALAGLPLELCNGGQQLIDPVYVDDVAAVLAAAISGPYGEVTEAGTGKELSVAQAAKDIAAAAGAAYPFTSVTVTRAGEPEGARVVADMPVCPNPWPYMVTETVEWYRHWLATLWYR